MKPGWNGISFIPALEEEVIHLMFYLCVDKANNILAVPTALPGLGTLARWFAGVSKVPPKQAAPCQALLTQWV